MSTTKIQFEDGGTAHVNAEAGTLVLAQEDGMPMAGVALDTAGAMELAAALTSWVAQRLPEENATAARMFIDGAERSIAKLRELKVSRGGS